MNNDTFAQIINNPKEAGLLCLASFKYFIQIYHYYLYRKPFIFKPFHLQIINALENRVLGESDKRNLLINVAPRSGKSQILQYFVAWGYTINYQSNFILTSYGDSLVMKFSDAIKGIINSPLYREMFNLELDAKNTAKEFWKMKNGGELRASAMGSIITGFGAGIMNPGWGGALVIDDPLKAADFKSEASRQNCIDFYTNTLKSRLNSPETPIILIMQRLHTEDLTGYILANEPQDWEHISLPTIDEDNGTSIWEEQFPVQKLMEYKRILPFFYYSQYQQEPIILGGQVIKGEWFKYYPQNQEYKYKRLVIAADTAMKTKEHNDYSVIMCGGITQDDKLHVLDMIRGKWEAPDLKRKAKDFWNNWQRAIPGVYCSGFYIEDKASGTGLIQELKREGGMPIKPIIADKDKLTRVESVLSHIECGNVMLPNSAEYGFNPDIISECECFTRDLAQKHDDIVDTLVYLIMNTIQKLKVSYFD